MQLLAFPAIAAAVLAAACATGGTVTALPVDGDWVSYETYPGPFCGRCDTTKITVYYDGRTWIEQGHWAGNYRNWRVSRGSAEITREALATFRARLEAFRPSGVLGLNDRPSCETFSSDSSGLIIVWHDQLGSARLDYNFGCDPETRRAMREALVAAPTDLGIPGLRFREWEPNAGQMPSDRIQLEIRTAPPAT